MPTSPQGAAALPVSPPQPPWKRWGRLQCRSSFRSQGCVTVRRPSDDRQLRGYGAALDNVVVTHTAATGATCKNSGWKTMHDNLGNMFKNQGDCVRYYAAHGKNLGSVNTP